MMKIKEQFNLYAFVLLIFISLNVYADVVTVYPFSNTPFYDNSSIPKLPRKHRSNKISIYNDLLKTCNYWTGLYNKQPKKELYRLSMNSSCRKHAEYGRKELGWDMRSPNNEKKAPSKTQNRSTKLINSSGIQKSSSAQCNLWRKEKDNIQNQLRAGYRENTGNRLRAQRKEVSKLIHDKC